MSRDRSRFWAGRDGGRRHRELGAGGSSPRLILKQIPHALGYDQSWEGELAFLQLDGHNTFSEISYALSALSPGAIIVTVVSLAVLLLWQNPRLYREETAKGCFTIRLTEHMTFLNKAALKRILREVPRTARSPST